jgi:hypothetical protein
MLKNVPDETIHLMQDIIYLLTKVLRREYRGSWKVGFDRQ